MDTVAQDADSGNLYVHDVARRELPDTLWGPGEDQVACFKGHDATDVLDQHRDREDHVLHRATLALNPIDAPDDLESRPVDILGNPWPDRTEGVEALGTAPLAIGLLQVACGHIVGAGETPYICHRFTCGDIPRPPTDHDPDLGLVFHLLRCARHHDRFVGAD